MRVLSVEEAQNTLGNRGKCNQCQKDREKCWCVDCEEIVWLGHRTGCLLYFEFKHQGHTLQHRDDDPEKFTNI